MTIHWYGLLIGLAVVGGWSVVERRLDSARHASLARAIPTIILFSIVGARLYHIFTDFHLYADQSVLSWFAVWNGGLGIFGAIFGGLLGGFLYARLHHWSRAEWWFFLDTVLVIVPWMQAFGRVGNWINKEVYGLPTNLPWGIVVRPGEEKVHPLFLYEIIGLILLGLILNTQRSVYKRGVVTGIYLIGYGIIRFFLEFLRPNVFLIAGFSLAQWICAGCMIVGGFLLYKNSKSHLKGQ